jgi:anhydro-N-acetylmuramic acid kinase
MSGTSLDGIDVALLELLPRGKGYDFILLRGATIPFVPELRARLFAASPPNEPAPREVATLDRELGAAIGEAIVRVARGEAVDFVASHGVTLYHDGSACTSVQIGDPFVIRERVQATVLSDFRRADCAAGGQGAPLVPYVDALLFRGERDAVALNVGGIANLTIVPRGSSSDDVRAWDTGPGNMLLDAFVRQRTRGEQPYDALGEAAARGTVDRPLLFAMLADPFFHESPPKSTGRERFGQSFLDRFATELDRLNLDDGCATLLALTVEPIVAAILDRAPRGSRVIVSGGGARNRELLRLLAERLPSCSIERPEDFGIDADLKEAISFAVLGYETLRGRAAVLPRVTGARHASLLGTIVPYAFYELLGKIAREAEENEG